MPYLAATQSELLDAIDEELRGAARDGEEPDFEMVAEQLGVSRYTLQTRVRRLKRALATRATWTELPSVAARQGVWGLDAAR